MMKLVVCCVMTMASLSVDASVLTVWGIRDHSRQGPFWMTTLVFHGSDDTACRHALDSFTTLKLMRVTGWTCYDDGGNELWGEDRR